MCHMSVFWSRGLTKLTSRVCMKVLNPSVAFKGILSLTDFKGVEDFFSVMEWLYERVRSGEIGLGVGVSAL